MGWRYSLLLTYRIYQFIIPTRYTYPSKEPAQNRNLKKAPAKFATTPSHPLPSPPLPTLASKPTESTLRTASFIVFRLFYLSMGGGGGGGQDEKPGFPMPG